MKRTITTQELKASVGEIVDAARLRGDRFVIERDGQPLAALVPLDTLEAEERNRKRLAELMESVSSRNAEKDDAELEG
jgi:antitoxin (DNA-binding transcriptional repressor) of toxin-antitoxin stability system